MSGLSNIDPNLMSQLAAQTVQTRNTRQTPVGNKGRGKTTGSGGSSNDTYNTRVTPLIGGEQIFPTAREMIREAKDSVAVEIYSFGNQKLEGKENVAGVTDAQHFKDQAALVDELIAARKRGVRVQVLMDSSRGRDGKPHNWQVADYLKANGVEVIRYPKSKAKIDHVKLLVVDNNRAMIGGMNWGEHSPVNRDANVLIEGREAAELKKSIFDSAARFSGAKPSKTTLKKDRENKIDVLTTQPEEQDGGSSAIKKAILDNINGAKKSVHAELFCLTDKDIVKSLKDAHDRGVDVKVLLDPNLYIINRKAFYKLKDAGVPVRWYKVDVSREEKLHSKWATIDGKRTIIGSANWSHSGLVGGGPGKRTNREADVLVRDEGATSIFEKEFMDDWNNRSSVRVPDHMRFE